MKYPVKAVLNTDRFKDLVWAKEAQSKNIMLGGLGGIGSWTALLLSRAGYIVHGFDYDHVEEHNLGGQLYSNSQVTTLKSEGTANVLNELAPGNSFSGYNIKLNFTQGGIPMAYSISGFDNMAIRKQMFEAWNKAVQEGSYSNDVDPAGTPFFIDGRMRAEGFQLYYVTPGNDSAERYAKTLFNDKDVPDEVCTIKATSHIGAMIASFITGIVNNHFALEAGDDARFNPYLTIVDLELFTIKQESL